MIITITKTTTSKIPIMIFSPFFKFICSKAGQACSSSVAHNPQKRSFTGWHFPPQLVSFVLSPANIHNTDQKRYTPPAYKPCTLSFLPSTPEISV